MLRIGWARLGAAMVAQAGAVKTEDFEYNFPREVQAIRYTVRIVVDRCSSRGQADTGSRRSPTAECYVSCGDKCMSGNAMEEGAEWQWNSTERLGGEYDLEPRRSIFFLHTESKYPFQVSTK